MKAMWLPTLAGIARATRIGATGSPNNVGANFSEIGYTAPEGRGALITMAWIQLDAGTAPSLLTIDHLTAGGAAVTRAVREVPPAARVMVQMEGWVWLAEAEQLRFGITIGDATTDIDWAWAGIEFDWVDVT